MPHEKVYGFCENKCAVEVLPKSVLIGAVNLSLPASGWVTSTVKAGYFEQAANAKVKAGEEIPWSAKPAGVIPTEAEEDAYNAIKSRKVEDGRIIFYAEEKPTVDLTIMIKGVLP